MASYTELQGLAMHHQTDSECELSPIYIEENEDTAVSLSHSTDNSDSDTTVHDESKDEPIADDDIETVSVTLDSHSNELVLVKNSNQNVYVIQISRLRTIFPNEHLIELAYDAVGRYTVETLLLFRQWLWFSLPHFKGLGGDIDESNHEFDYSINKLGVEYLYALIDLYELGLDQKLYRLQNEIIDRIRARKTCEDGFFARLLVAKVYSVTAPHAKLREYLIDYFLYKVFVWDLDEIRRKLQKHSLHGNIAFVDDVQSRYGKSALSMQGPIDPNKKGRCFYHYHDENYPLCS